MKNWVVILLLIVFFPVGLYLMWAKTDWKKKTKVIVTVIIAILFIFGIASNSSDSNNTVDMSKSTVSTTAEETTTKKLKAEEFTTEEITTIELTTVKPTTAEPATEEITTEEPKTEKVTDVATSITVTSITSNVNAGQTASVSIQGAPNTNYSISVRYKSGNSKAAGLETKTSDSSGNVSWSWEVGAKTSSGTYPITIVGGGTSTKTEFTVN